ncbi:hypothetical protein [Brevibacillus sp. LEMMJ03]|uniref:hypothetical protein n=1 Tax=Brevibacillus sp. LEMMJ03 TaxID=2595056 RepID=UPI00163D9067|nr:hypothetical protein [Brevibacillus sp. LEMMJ03]
MNQTAQSNGPSPEAWERAYSFIITNILPRIIEGERVAGRLEALLNAPKQEPLKKVQNG